MNFQMVDIFCMVDNISKFGIQILEIHYGKTLCSEYIFDGITYESRISLDVFGIIGFFG